MSLSRKPKSWEEQDKEAWEAAAAKLDVRGYERELDFYWPAVFTKADCPQIVLVRDLAKLNWHPCERRQTPL